MNRIFTTPMDLKNHLDTHNVYTFASMPRKLEECDVLLFAAATKDTNPAHISGEFAKHSIFKRKVSHGIGTVARAEGEFVQMFQFSETPVEIIATGIKDLHYTEALGIGDTYHYEFSFSDMRVGKNNKWKLQCRIICVVGKKVIAEWDWAIQFIDHSAQVPVATLQLLYAKSVVRSLYEGYIKGPLQQLAVWAAVTSFFGLMIVGMIRQSNRPLEICPNHGAKVPPNEECTWNESPFAYTF